MPREIMLDVDNIEGELTEPRTLIDNQEITALFSGHRQTDSLGATNLPSPFDGTAQRTAKNLRIVSAITYRSLPFLLCPPPTTISKFNSTTFSNITTVL